MTINLAVTRHGKFTISPKQFHQAQCGKTGKKTYTYEVTIKGTNKTLTTPDGFLIDNALIDQFFQETFKERMMKSCELVACDVIEYFKSKFTDTKITGINVVISGSDHSHITASWSS